MAEELKTVRETDPLNTRADCGTRLKARAFIPIINKRSVFVGVAQGTIYGKMPVPAFESWSI